MYIVITEGICCLPFLITSETSHFLVSLSMCWNGPMLRTVSDIIYCTCIYVVTYLLYVCYVPICFIDTGILTIILLYVVFLSM